MKLLLVIASLGLLAGCGGGASTSTKPAEYETTARIDCYCADDSSDLYTLRQLLERQDSRAVIALVRQGKLHVVESGDPVRVIGEIGGAKYVRMLGGSAIGKRCYMAPGFLTRER